MKQDFFVIT